MTDCAHKLSLTRQAELWGSVAAASTMNPAQFPKRSWH